jgi:hypothetical protein
LLDVARQRKRETSRGAARVCGGAKLSRCRCYTKRCVR